MSMNHYISVFAGPSDKLVILSCVCKLILCSEYHLNQTARISTITNTSGRTQHCHVTHACAPTLVEARRTPPHQLSSTRAIKELGSTFAAAPAQ